jgi:hypothetical protein
VFISWQFETLPYFCAYHKAGPGYPTSYVMLYLFDIKLLFWTNISWSQLKSDFDIFLTTKSEKYVLCNDNVKFFRIIKTAKVNNSNYINKTNNHHYQQNELSRYSPQLYLLTFNVNKIATHCGQKYLAASNFK